MAAPQAATAVLPEAGAAGQADPAAAPGQARLLLECRGVVQGVGFRPAVHHLARQLGLGGSLHNAAGLVRLTLTGERSALERFVADLPRALPPGARLEPLQPRWLADGAGGSAGAGEAADRLAATAVAPADPAPAAGVAQPTAAAAVPTLTISAEPERAAAPLVIGLIAPSLAADRAPCAACLRELDDPLSRRHGDPFLSCCACGPRYAIATAEPWRRAHTTLAGFRPCPACAAEFADPTDRRFHSETISCPACGPRLSLLPATAAAPLPQRAPEAPQPASPMRRSLRQPLAVPQPSARSTPAAFPALPPPPPPGMSAAAHHAALIDAAAVLLEQGQILALQGVGGFQLLVDAANRAAVARLRRRKRRPAKPLALLVADPAWIAADVRLDSAALALLHSPAAPIVLLPRRPGAAEAPAGSVAPGPRERWPDPFPGVAPGSAQLGVLLPASPLHRLLARRFGRPLVCTSGNRSGEPLCTDPTEAFERLAGIADAFLIHDRPIARPLDDSLAQLIENRPALLRRARGYAPEPLALPLTVSPTLPLTPPAMADAWIASMPPVDRHAALQLEIADHGPTTPRPGPAGADRTLPGNAPHSAATEPAAAESAATEPAPAGPERATRRRLPPALQGLPEAGCAGGPQGRPNRDEPPPAAPSPGAALALGGDLKAAPAVALAGRVWLAPHLGDLSERRCYERFRAGIAELNSRYGDQLAWIAIDRHPGYLSHQLGVALAPSPATIQMVQHHAAHALAVVAEHGLVPPLLAFCADGLGYGQDPIVVERPAAGRAATGRAAAGRPAAGRAAAGRAATGQPVDGQPVDGFQARGLSWEGRPAGALASPPNGSAGRADGVPESLATREPPLWGGELLVIGSDRPADPLQDSLQEGDPDHRPDRSPSSSRSPSRNPHRSLIRIDRLACLRPLPLPGGDRAAREPRRVALGLLAAAGPRFLEHPGAGRCRRAFRAAERELLVAMIAKGVQCPWSSSLGRLFDGVASLLGLCQRISHEGEAGLRLQALAAQAAVAAQRVDPGRPDASGLGEPPLGPSPCRDGEREAANRSDPWGVNPEIPSPDASQRRLPSPLQPWSGGGAPSDPPCRLEHTYPFPRVPAAAADGSPLPLGWLDWQPLLEALLADRVAGESAARCALRFHRSVAEGVADLLASAARSGGCRTVVLAGGCFQNVLLLEELLVRLRRRGLDPHTARAVPGNDGGLALGQLWACGGAHPSPPPRHPPEAAWADPGCP